MGVQDFGLVTGESPRRLVPKLRLGTPGGEALLRVRVGC